MMENLKNERGSLILETSIVLPLFILVIVFVLGVFNIVNAQNQITHALIQSTNSLSLDTYLINHIDSLDEYDHKLDGLSDIFIELIRDAYADDLHFTTKTDWHKNKGEDLEAGEVKNVDSSIAQQRFVGYLTGGDDDAADERLNALGVIDGLNGMNFKMETDGANVTVTIKYTLQFWADFFGIGKIPMEQSITAKLW